MDANKASLGAIPQSWPYLRVMTAVVASPEDYVTLVTALFENCEPNHGLT